VDGGDEWWNAIASGQPSLARVPDSHVHDDYDAGQSDAFSWGGWDWPAFPISNYLAARLSASANSHGGTSDDNNSPRSRAATVNTSAAADSTGGSMGLRQAPSSGLAPRSAPGASSDAQDSRRSSSSPQHNSEQAPNAARLVSRLRDSPTAERPAARGGRFSCPRRPCEKSFLTRRDLRRHNDTVHDQRYTVCPGCSKPIKQRSDNIKRHLERYCKRVGHGGGRQGLDQMPMSARTSSNSHQ